MAQPDPVPREVRTELTRVVRRWQSLPLDDAHSHVPLVRALLARLDPAGCGPPDLGPGVVMDQLTVLVFDACALGGKHDQLASQLAELRQALAQP